MSNKSRLSRDAKTLRDREGIPLSEAKRRLGLNKINPHADWIGPARTVHCRGLVIDVIDKTPQTWLDRLQNHELVYPDVEPEANRLSGIEWLMNAGFRPYPNALIREILDSEPHEDLFPVAMERSVRLRGITDIRQNLRIAYASDPRTTTGTPGFIGSTGISEKRGGSGGHVFFINDSVWIKTAPPVDPIEVSGFTPLHGLDRVDPRPRSMGIDKHHTDLLVKRYSEILREDGVLDIFDQRLLDAISGLSSYSVGSSRFINMMTVYVETFGDRKVDLNPSVLLKTLTANPTFTVEITDGKLIWYPTLAGVTESYDPFDRKFVKGKIVKKDKEFSTYLVRGFNWHDDDRYGRIGYTVAEANDVVMNSAVGRAIQEVMG